MAGNILKKYLWVLDKLTTHGALSFEELNSYWQKSTISEGQPLSKRTFQNFKEGIFDIFNIEIECEKAGDYRYSLASNSKDNQINNPFVESLLLQNHIQNSPVLRQNVVNLDLGDQDILVYFMNLIEERTIISFEYLGLPIPDNDICSQCLIQHFLPLSLVCSNKKWFMIGMFTSDFKTQKVKGKYAQYRIDSLAEITIESQYCGKQIPFNLRKYIDTFSLKDKHFTPLPDKVYSDVLYEDMYYDDSRQFLRCLWFSKYWWQRGDDLIGHQLYDYLKTKQPLLYKKALKRMNVELISLDDWMKR